MTLRLFVATSFLTAAPRGALAEVTSQQATALATTAPVAMLQGALRVVFFLSPGCQYRERVHKALPKILRRRGDRIRLERRDISDEDVFKEFFLYDEHYGSKSKAPPVVYVGGQYLAGADAIVDRLDDVIGEELAKGSATFVPSSASGGEWILARFRGFSVVAILRQEGLMRFAAAGRCSPHGETWRSTRIPDEPEAKESNKTPAGCPCHLAEADSGGLRRDSR